jgi:hypothetical protein
MATRSYPTDDFDQRADDMSAEHPDVVEHCRRAHQVAVAHERGDADTEQLRQAAISYRSLVQALLGDHAHPDHGQGDQARGDRIHDDRANGARSEKDRSDEQSRPGAAKANGNQQQTATTTSTNRSDA